MTKLKVVTIGFLKLGIGHYLAHLSYYLKPSFYLKTITFTHGIKKDLLEVEYDLIIKKTITNYKQLINPHGIRETFTSTKNVFTELQKYDLINIHISSYTRLSSPILIPGLISAKNKGIKIVATIHDVLPFPEGETVSEYLRFYYNLSDAAIVGNEKEKDLLIKYFDYKNPIYIAVHGIYELFNVGKTSREEALKKLNLKEDEEKMLFFGILRKNKGLDTLIKAFKIIKDKNLLKTPKLIIAVTERTDTFTPFEKLINELGLKKEIQVYKNKQGFDIPEIEKFFKAADVLVLPYTQASQSGVLNIAFAFKTPVILSLKFAESEKFDGKIGIVIKPNDPYHLAQKIAEFFSTLPDKKSIYTKNIEDYNRKHSFKQTAEVHKKAFLKAIKQR